MAKSKNVKLGVEPEAIDLTNVDLTPSPAGSALDKLRASAAPKPEVTQGRPSRTVESDIAKSLDTPDLGSAYEKTTARMARANRPAFTGDEKPLVNLNKASIEGIDAKQVERLDEEPTNVPRHMGGEGFFRNQIHGDYSHFAKATNLIGYLGDKAAEAQKALANHPEHAAKLDAIHQILAVASGHITDAQTAHRRGETGLVRINPTTGLAKAVGRQFLRQPREDEFGGQAIEREIGFNPIEKVNQEIGEPQLRSEGLSTAAIRGETPFGAVPHYHRAIQHIVTAANLLQGSLASTSSDVKIAAQVASAGGPAVKNWDGKYDERAGDPDTVNHATKLSDEYANSVARAGSEIVRNNDDMAETGTSSVKEKFDSTKKAYENEQKAKVQQAEIHAGLVTQRYREEFGPELAVRKEAAARRTEELRTLPVVPAPSSTNSMWSGDTLESRIAKKQNTSDQEYAEELGKSSLSAATSAVGMLDTLKQHAKDAAASGKIDSATLDEINRHAEEAVGHHDAAQRQAAKPIEMPEEPTMTYDASRDPRFKPKKPIAYERMSPREKAAERDKFLTSRGQSLVSWQREVKSFEEKMPVIRARDSAALASYKSAKARAVVDHHTEVHGRSRDAINSVSKIHSLLQNANVITPVEPTSQPVDITGIPTPETFAKASAGRGRPATRGEALELMQSENEKAQAEATAKAQAEAEKKTALEASRPERPAIEQAKDLGFLTLDEETAKQFLAAGGAATPGSGIVGKRRSAFLEDLATRNAVDFSPRPRAVAPGRALFIAPDAGIPETPAPAINPKKARRQERLRNQSSASARRRAAGQVNTLGLDIDKAVLAPERPQRVRSGVSDAQLEAEENKAIVEGLKRTDTSVDAISKARTSLQNIEEFNANADPVNTVSTTTKVTRRTRK